MKYSVNHPWKFRNPELAFVTGFLQMSISFFIELTNIYIVLANGETQFDIIADFIIMLVIADFDTYFYNVRRADKITEMLTDPKFADLFTWEVSTSWDAKAKIKENELKEEKILMMHEMHGRPKYVHLRFKQRTCLNAFLYIVYKFFNLLYTAFFYYFMPFISSFLLFVLLINTNRDQAKQAYDDLTASV